MAGLRLLLAVARARLRQWPAVIAVFFPVVGCKKSPAADARHDAASVAPLATPASASASEAQQPRRSAILVSHETQAMGTSLKLLAYTTDRLDAARTRQALLACVSEVERLETLLSEWRADSEVSQVNARAGDWVALGPESFEVIRRALWAGNVSRGSFDITFQALSGLWRFGSAQEPNPEPPGAAEVARRRKLVDYRRVELDAAKRRVRIGADQAIGLGGVAKGYVVDRAAQSLRAAGLKTFLVQAGGDLYGAGRKPDGSHWVSGIQDPRGGEGELFASLELEDHAFSTAGDYARSYVVGGRRYHHIIDPRTGYPATASRSVTVWAIDATTADVLDDAVFILGPREGLKLASSMQDVGVVIVDAANRVHVSERLKPHVKVLKQPTEGP
jgi:thiamine biosynthesis lipoprotein